MDQWTEAIKEKNNNIQYFINHPILSVFTSPRCSSCNSAFRKLSNDMLHDIVCHFYDLNKTILLLNSKFQVAIAKLLQIQFLEERYSVCLCRSCDKVRLIR